VSADDSEDIHNPSPLHVQQFKGTMGVHEMTWKIYIAVILGLDWLQQMMETLLHINSSGYGEITSKILKAGASLISRALSHIFNHLLYTGIFLKMGNSKT